MLNIQTLTQQICEFEKAREKGKVKTNITCSSRNIIIVWEQTSFPFNVFLFKKV